MNNAKINKAKNKIRYEVALEASYMSDQLTISDFANHILLPQF